MAHTSSWHEVQRAAIAAARCRAAALPPLIRSLVLADLADSEGTIAAIGEHRVHAEMASATAHNILALSVEIEQCTFTMITGGSA